MRSVPDGSVISLRESEVEEAAVLLWKHSNVVLGAWPAVTRALNPHLHHVWTTSGMCNLLHFDILSTSFLDTLPFRDFFYLHWAVSGCFSHEFSIFPHNRKHLVLLP